MTSESRPARPPSPGSSPPPTAPPLATLLLATAHCLHAVLIDGRSLTVSLEAVRPEWRGGAQDLSYHALRHWGYSQATLQHLLTREPPEALVKLLLAAALPLLRPPEPDSRAPQYNAFTVVDQAVRASQREPRLRRFKGLINACLRQYQRQAQALAPQLEANPVARWNHPEWWIRQLQQDHPDQWQTILQAAQAPAPLTLRINPRRASRADVQTAFAQHGIACEPVHEHGLVLARAQPVQKLPGFQEGWWSVQDAGAQLAAPLLAPLRGMRVLDACAAPGGKAAHLLETADIDLTALDRDATRLQRVAQSLQRLGLQARLCVGDASRPQAWWDGQPFDAILADVPCTASGIVRRHPDIRWLRRETDLPATAALQQQILDALWSLLAPGGTLVYVTCSVFLAEGDRQALQFLERQPGARRLSAPGQLLPSPPGTALRDQHDGFYYARFSKA